MRFVTNYREFLPFSNSAKTLLKISTLRCGKPKKVHKNPWLTKNTKIHPSNEFGEVLKFHMRKILYAIGKFHFWYKCTLQIMYFFNLWNNLIYSRYSLFFFLNSSIFEDRGAGRGCSSFIEGCTDSHTVHKFRAFPHIRSYNREINSLISINLVW